MYNSELNGRGHAPIMESSVSPDHTPRGMYEGEQVLSLADLIRLVRRRLWVIVLLGLAFAGSAAGFSFFQTPTYEASIKLLIGQKQDSNLTPDLGNEVAGLQQLTATMVEAVKTRPVAKGVIQRLDLSMSPTSFLENLSVEQVGSTQFIEVSYEDPSPERAARTANTIGDVFSEKVSEASPSANAITATVWEEAAVPDSPASPAILRNVLLALVFGLMVGGGLAFILDFLDNSWRSPEEVEQISGVPTYGVIPAFKIHKRKKETSQGEKES